MASSSTSFAFPSSESPNANTALPVPPSPQRRQHLLSFRRISLPTPPTLLNRQSSASLTSYDSFPEESAGESPAQHSAVVRNAGRKALHRPFSIEANQRQRRRRDSAKPLDVNKAAKRRQIITEFHDTERAYVEGLDLIYFHFLTPIIESLDTPSPLLEREDLVSVFSNFIDIWNLHRSFFTSLTRLLSASLAQPGTSPPALSPVLLSHFPYLSLYTPFITSFPELLDRLANISLENSAFDAFIKRQEADERCGKLKLRDWLLTIVQRCPRYLLLLKDLIKCTDPDDPEHASLMEAHALLEKVTTSLDTSLHIHAQTLTLLALQRATLNLPIQLVTPGRTLLKRGKLIQLDNSSVLKERDFFLFSDCLLWLANDRMIEAEWLRRSDAAVIGGMAFLRGGPSGIRPDFKRTRSKSENEIQDTSISARGQASGSPKGTDSSQVEERWWFKGKIDLVDIEVVVSSARERSDERCLEILSPEMSFALYADTEQIRNDWVSALRGAKASLLVSLNVMHPNSTLASSMSTSHIRRSLQALPYLTEEDEVQSLPKRGKVDHFVPAIWVPDGRSDSCMRCGRTFGWRRRRHHCRLCGRCICSGCSERTFFISDPSAKDTGKSARACNACYDTVFPVIESSSSEGTITQAHSGSTLSSFPSWKTQRPIPRNAPRPSELMELDAPTQLSSSPGRRVGVIRRHKPRPVSHPVIPQMFGDSDISALLAAPRESRDENVANKSEDPEDPREGQAQAQVLEDISSASLNAPSPHESTSSPIIPSTAEEISARNQKRRSMPAIALQTTAVTTRPKVSGEGRSRRFSLVLGGKHRVSTHLQAHDYPNGEGDGREGNIQHGIAAARLTELLERTKSSQL
ncbi:hypothetical protein DFH11DRAFT_1556530 [Phellopilus nigrolimitatus]|nr:hypothetical protein DFH11DRAFT_1556530 [Phellopilus nigrolimitatus]